MKLIVGLGNPGKKYENTRHNLGFMILDNYLLKHNLSFSKTKYSGLYCELVLENEHIILLKPQKYINLSGEVIEKYIKYFKLNISDILIINDDLDIELGKYKLKASGSSAGHNGLKNIEQCLKTSEYKRLKIGISNNKEIDSINYVLGKFNKEESIIIDKVINTSENIINDYFILSFEELMNKYNKK